MPQLRSLIERLWNGSERYRRSYVEHATEPIWDTIRAEHGLLMEAIERREPAQCAQIIHLHIQRTRLRLEREGTWTKT
jgi:DNA-binding GntR family transcriptional regulator